MPNYMVNVKKSSYSYKTIQIPFTLFIMVLNGYLFFLSTKQFQAIYSTDF